MHKRMLWLAVLGLMWTMPVAAQDQPAAGPRNVVLVGWDGAHRDHIKTLLKADRLPNLKKLIDEGTLVDIDVTSGATDTKAGWTQILTGYRPEITGVHHNGNYRDVPAGYSVFERLKARFGTNTFAAVAVIGKKDHCGEINEPFKRPCEPATDDSAAQAGKPDGQKIHGGKGPTAKPAKRGRIVEENGQKFVVFDGSPYFTMHKACDEWHFGLREDTKVGDKALAMLDKYKGKPFFFFVHFGEVDQNGHRYGEPTAKYDEAIVSGDTQLGRLVEKLQAENLYGRTTIYVTADHGFDVGGNRHEYAPYVFLASNSREVVRDGTRADIAPTILDSFGLDLSKIEPKLDGASLRVVATEPIPKLGG